MIDTTTELFGKFRFRRINILELTDDLKVDLELPNRKEAAILRVRFIAMCLRRNDRCASNDSKAYNYQRDRGTVVTG